GDGVRHVGTADGAEEDGVVLAERVPAVFGNDAAGLLVKGGAPGKMVPFEARAILASGNIGHLDRVLDDLRTDPVAPDDPDAESCHCKNIPGWVRDARLSPRGGAETRLNLGGWISGSRCKSARNRPARPARCGASRARCSARRSTVALALSC